MTFEKQDKVLLVLAAMAALAWGWWGCTLLRLEPSLGVRPRNTLPSSETSGEERPWWTERVTWEVTGLIGFTVANIVDRRWFHKKQKS